MTAKKQFGINLLWNLAGNWSREVINFGVFLALARVLGPKSYGVMGMVAVFTALANMVLLDGLSTFIIREKNLEPEHTNAIFWLQVLIAGTMTAAMICLAPLAADIYGEPMIAEVMPVMGLLPLFFCLYSVPSALLQRAMRYRPLTIRGLLASSIGGGVGIGMAVAGYGVWSLVLMILAQWLVSCSCLWGVTDWRPGLRFTRRHLRDVSGFGAQALSVKGLIFVNQQLPRFVIGAALGAVPLGYFTMAWRIIEVMSILTVMPIGQVMLPTLGAMQDDPPRLKAGLGSAIELSAAISLPCYLGLFAVAPVMLPALYGSRWDGAIPLLQLFAIFGIAWSMVFSLDAALVATGRMTSRTRSTLLGLVVLAAGLFATRNDGLTAIGIVIVGCEFLCGGLYGMVLSRHACLDWGDVARRTAPFAGAALVMLLVVSAFRMVASPSLEGIMLTGAMIVIGAITYLAAVMLFAGDRAAMMVQAGLSLRRHRNVPS
jgi:PST family polysaccharide transporter